MMKKQKNEEKEKVIYINRKRLVISSLYAFASLSFFTAYSWIPVSFKYTRQFMVFFGFLFLIIFLLSLKKLITHEMKMELYRRIGNAIFGFMTKLKKITKKVKKVLGIKERERLYSDDEKRIIIKNDTGGKRKRQKPLTEKRFSSLTDHRERVRFIYAKFVIGKRKEGISCNSFDSPEEIREKTANGRIENQLFDLYTPVRYSKEYTPTDEEIKEQYDYFSKRIKLK